MVLNNTSVFGFSSFVRAAAGEVGRGLGRRLAAEAVQGLALALQRVHHIHGSDRLAAGVLGVGDRIADD